MSTQNLSDGGRGRARYFHGRKRILASFSNLLRYAIHNEFGNSGTNFLIEAPPGAGKTALLHQCSDPAKAGGTEAGGKKWNVIWIGRSAFYSLPALIKQAARAVEMHDASFPWLDLGEETYEQAFQLSDVYVPQCFASLASEQPLLLVWDEVQNAHKSLEMKEARVLRSILNRIHNGKFKRPIVLVCAGLETSSDTFWHLGISRFSIYCQKHMGRLPEADARAIIKDWLVKDGGAQKADIQPWIEAINQETHRWPQHITAYAQPAAELLKNHDGSATPESLAAAIEQGRKNKRLYYRSLLESLDNSGVEVLAAVLQQIPDPDNMNLFKTHIVKRLVKVGSMSQEAATQFFDSAFQKGILSNGEARSPLHYNLAIPSMNTHLLEVFGPEPESCEE